MKRISDKKFIKRAKIHQCNDCYCTQRARASGILRAHNEGIDDQLDADREEVEKIFEEIETEVIVTLGTERLHALKQKHLGEV